MHAVWLNYDIRLVHAVSVGCGLKEVELDEGTEFGSFQAKFKFM